MVFRSFLLVCTWIQHPVSIGPPPVRKEREGSKLSRGQNHIHSSTVCDLYTRPAPALSVSPCATNSRSESPPKSNSRSRSSSLIVVPLAVSDSDGDAVPLPPGVSVCIGTCSPSILPSTNSDSVPSSTVVVCLSEDPAEGTPLVRPDPLRSDVVDPLSLDDTRETSDALADRCCEVVYGLPRLDTLRGRGDIGLLL